MEKITDITEEERAKCQKVADAFAELYEMADIVVVDVILSQKALHCWKKGIRVYFKLSRLFYFGN